MYKPQFWHDKLIEGLIDGSVLWFTFIEGRNVEPLLMFCLALFCVHFKLFTNFSSIQSQYHSCFQGLLKYFQCLRGFVKAIRY